MFFTLARRYLPQSMRELASVECLWTRVRVCLQNFYVLATSSLALSNLLHFPDPLRLPLLRRESDRRTPPVSSFPPCHTPPRFFPAKLSRKEKERKKEKKKKKSPPEEIRTELPRFSPTFSPISRTIAKNRIGHFVSSRLVSSRTFSHFLSKSKSKSKSCTRTRSYRINKTAI